MSWWYQNYESKADIEARVERQIAKRRKQGEALVPVLPGAKTRDLSATFWGQAWNRNLMAYSDYESRMPRGRTYFRGGKVLDLALSAGKISSVVAGRELYDVVVSVKPLAEKRWKELKRRCHGGIGSLVELLAGTFSAEIMKEVTDLKHGLFPTPAEIQFSCTCPDWASLCKHCAATLYAVGARLDAAPGLFFELRQVDAGELTGTAASAVQELTTPASQSAERATAIEPSDLSALFGVEIGGAAEAPAPPAKTVAKKKTPAKKIAKKKIAKKTARGGKVSPKQDRKKR
ncbi:MAG: hypothetical protein KA004_11645 [Verrucomicrobiales bacterium]|nr:hypothetical protein [Verrucomicrobiales bacterium]